MAGRKFNWVSSSDVNNKLLLTDLHVKMISFYSGIESRNCYQQMVDRNDNNPDDPGIVTSRFVEFLKSINPKKILEIGCGSGRIYKFIEKEMPAADYTGIEVSKTIQEINRNKFPGAKWLVSDAYSIPVAAAVDVCFSFYVLEHLVFPEQALFEMMKTLKKDGFLILIFPDFVASGRFASQKIGLGNDSTALSKLKKGKILDAIISLYDSRIKLPDTLKNVVKKFGNFPVNLNPKCLSVQNIQMSPDIDAVYIASKNEVENWARQKGYTVSYPAGKDNYFAEHAFLSIQKTI